GRSSRAARRSAHDPGGRRAGQPGCPGPPAGRAEHGRRAPDQAVNAVSAPARATMPTRPMPAGSRRPGGLAVRLLRLQYWYDRLSEPQRLLAGLGAIVLLGTSWLYVLGLGSWVLVNRAEQFDPSRTGTVTQAPPI